MSDQQPAQPMVVYALFANADEARRIGRLMVERQLAACVNLLPGCQSIYRWDGQVESSSEAPAIFKTSREVLPDLMAAITSAHSYLVPSITAWPASASHPQFADWVSQETKPA